ncbi:MAG: hypothetical protein U0T56_05945 [Ferruginibacter sp.]
MNSSRFRISRISFPAQNHPSIRGLAVTIPYKEQVIPYLDRLDAVAAEAGAVNCIRVSGNDLTGFNTDITGFRRSLEPLLQPWHSQALVLGTGGASKPYNMYSVNCIFRSWWSAVTQLTRKDIRPTGRWMKKCSFPTN